MSYTTTDVICCFPGIGRTTFSAEVNKGGSTFCLDLDYDGEHLKEFVARVKAEREARAHRYILVPMDAEILAGLLEAKIPYLVVVPDPNEFDNWAKRWMHSGSSAETIIARRARWDELETVIGREQCVIQLKGGDWLGNVLEQTPATVKDGKDV